MGVILYPELKLMSCFPRRGNQEVTGRVGRGLAAKNYFVVVCKFFLALLGIGWSVLCCTLRKIWIN